MKSELILNKEMMTGKIITITNAVIGVIAFLPTLLCFLFTADAFLRTGSSGTDRFPEPAAGLEEKVLFSVASLLLIAFYRSVLINPFINADKITDKQMRLNYWLQVITINLMALGLFIYFMGDQFIPRSLFPEKEIQVVVYLFIYLPFIPLLISVFGCFYNLKQFINNSTFYEN